MSELLAFWIPWMKQGAVGEVEDPSDAIRGDTPQPMKATSIVFLLFGGATALCWVAYSIFSSLF